MRQLKLFIWGCLLVVAWGNISAEHVHFGDYTTPGVLDGDLVIVSGNLDIKDSLTINGELKVISGKVLVGSDVPSTTTVDLQINGDLTVINTEIAGEIDATITVSTGKLIVSGEIFTRSVNGKASIDGRYGVKAGKIETDGKDDAILESLEGAIDVVGDIFTKSKADAHIKARKSITAAAIFADGEGLEGGMTVVDPPFDGDTAFIEAGKSIDVMGMIVTKSKWGSAYLKATINEIGYIKADSIFTNGLTDASVSVVGEAYCYIDVANDIVTTSSLDNAKVAVLDGYIKAGNIATRAAKEAEVSATDYIEVMGDIVTQSHEDVAYVGGDSIYTIKAKSITTSAVDNAYVHANELIDVVEGIVTNCWGGGDADILVAANPGSPGLIKAGSIKTQAYDGDANVGVNFGSIIVRGTINTYSRLGDASVKSIVGDIEAENVYTHAAGDARVEANGSSDIHVKDVIKTKSVNGDAPVIAKDDIHARSIMTEAYDAAYIESDDESIIVQEDISTKSETGPAYVKALNGNITAQRIRTEAPAGQDDSIQSQAGTGHFMWVYNEDDAAKIIKDAEFDLDADHDWNTMVTLRGTCTLNGKGHKITFGPSGGIIVDEGTTLYLHNIKINNVWDEAIKGMDTDSVIHFTNVTWTLTDDYSFKNGKMVIDDDFRIFGPGTSFSYESAVMPTINPGGQLSFNKGMTVSFDTGSEAQVSMVDETSRLNFNGLTLYVAEDIRFMKGTLVFDNKVTFSVLATKTVYFGDGVANNNIGFEYHVSAHLNQVGLGAIVLANV
jgi:hypothetical protein